MNVKFLNPFVEAAYEVLQAETGVGMMRGELGLDKGAYVTDDVTVIISLVGRVEGTVFYSMSEETAVALASRILGEQLKTFNGLAQSGVAELGNVITGRASVKLAEAGYEANISPPTLLTGKGATISTLDFARLVVPLGSECGSVAIHLALREGANRGLSAAALPVPARPAAGG
ncbi:MAG: chemotaxis protein CheX [Chloroflexi bacterium]|nr:chemotaxis protein CheX [Chloroflexota bacterium]